MKRLLILFANGFPYNISEPFLETECPLYREYFDKVLLSTACARGEAPTRQLDACIELQNDYTLNKDLRSVVASIPYLLTDGTYYQELIHLCQTGELTFGRFYEITVTALCGNHRAYQVKKWLKKQSSYDQIVLYSYWMTIPAYGALKLKRLLNDPSIRVISRCHGYDLYCERSKTGYLPFQEENIRQLDVVAPVSQSGMEYLAAKYDGLCNLRTQYLGVAGASYEQPTVPRVPLKIVSCARVIPLKRLTRIVDALTELEQMSVHWTHIGGGAGLDALYDYATEKLSGTQNIQFELLGTLPNAQVRELYATKPFHVFLNVSETEGIPVAIMEAMSFGIPVIATDVGGTSELVTDGRSGYLLSRDYVDETLAVLLRRIAGLPEDDYTLMRLYAGRTIQEKFNADTNYRHFIEEVLL